MPQIHREYLNGNPIVFGKDGDHVKVRAILAKGIVPRVSNFGPLHKDRKVNVKEVLTIDGYELHVEHVPEAHGYAITPNGGSLTTAKDVNDVWYQRIDK